MSQELIIAKKVWDKVFGHIFVIKSMDYVRGIQGIKYQVKQSGTDIWTCDCQSFLFKSGLRDVIDQNSKLVYFGTCKHIRFAMEKSGMKVKWK